MPILALHYTGLKSSKSCQKYSILLQNVLLLAEILMSILLFFYPDLYSLNSRIKIRTLPCHQTCLSMLMMSLITLCCLAVSLFLDRKRTLVGVKRGLMMFLKLFPTLLLLLGLTSIVLYFVPEEVLVRYMGPGSGVIGWLIAAVFGSVALLPGFVAFPICNVLLQSGVATSTVAVFITTLMMVGVVSMPVEAKFFGWRVTLLRNGVSFVAALIIGFIMGLIL